MSASEAAASRDPGDEPLESDRVTKEAILADGELREMIELADRYLDAIGYTNHGLSHVGRVSANAERILRELGMPKRDSELAAIAGLLHDIGNIVHRERHQHTGGILAFEALRRLGMPIREIAVVTSAIGNHDETDGQPINAPCAALIISDKCDVIRSRVRNRNMIHFDIHDRVNYAAEGSRLIVDREAHLITLELDVDNSISTVMEYFEIFTGRMKMSRRAAQYLNCDFRLVVNGTALS